MSPMPRVPRGGGSAARIRSALAWADLDIKQLAEKIGKSPRTIARWTSGEKQPPLEIRQQIAEICGVPAVFMETGFASMERPLSDAERGLHDVQAQVTDLGLALAEQAANTLRLEREIEALRNTGRRPERPRAAQ